MVPSWSRKAPAAIKKQGEPAWVSPCTLIPLDRPSLAGSAAGVEFLLLHLPLTFDTAFIRY